MDVFDVMKVSMPFIIRTYFRSKATLNYQAIVETTLVVDGSIPSCEIISLFDGN